jgi:hypothetical protein
MEKLLLKTVLIANIIFCVILICHFLMLSDLAAFGGKYSFTEVDAVRPLYLSIIIQCIIYTVVSCLLFYLLGRSLRMVNIVFILYVVAFVIFSFYYNQFFHRIAFKPIWTVLITDVLFALILIRLNLKKINK